MHPIDKRHSSSHCPFLLQPLSIILVKVMSPASWCLKCKEDRMPSYHCHSWCGIPFMLCTWQHHTSIWYPWYNNCNATLQMTAPPCAMHSSFISWANTHDQGCLLIFSQGEIIRSYPDVFIMLIHQEYCPHHSQR